MPLNSNEYIHPSGEPVKGQVIIKEFSINEKMLLPNEKTEFEKFITENNQVVIPSNSAKAIRSGYWLLDNSKQIAAITVVLASVSLIMFLRKRYG